MINTITFRQDYIGDTDPCESCYFEEHCKYTGEPILPCEKGHHWQLEGTNGQKEKESGC